MATKTFEQFITSKFFGDGITFDDVLIMPAYATLIPKQIDITSKLTQQLQLQIPFLSAAMDTVTEAKLAVAIAREGGLGFIHKNMSIAQQAEQIRKVKRSDSGLIIDPITLLEDATIGEALQLMADNKIGGIPIINKQHKLVGILTNRDLRFVHAPHKKVSEIMTKENIITAPEGTDLKRAETLLSKHKIEKLPVVNKQGKLIGLITYKDIIKLTSHPNAGKDGFGRLQVGAALGISADLVARAEAVIAVGVDVVGLDSAHGHSKGVIDALKILRKQFPKLQIVAGNVATAEGAKALAAAGANAVKVGIGPGSICTTRIVAGAGVPQLTAIMGAAYALKGTNIPVIADGGIRFTGDVVKAIAAGADCVMMGSVFAGTDESPGETVLYEGRKFKTYRGMGSLGAMNQGSSDRYFQDGNQEAKKYVPEGIEGRVAFKGNVQEVLYQYTGGLRSGMGYAGVNNINELKTKATFVKISNAGINESHAHDIDITKEAPNYSRK